MLKRFLKAVLSILDNTGLEPDGYGESDALKAQLEGKFIFYPPSKFAYHVYQGVIYWTPLSADLHYSVFLRMENTLRTADVVTDMFDALERVDEHTLKFKSNSLKLFKAEAGAYLGPFMEAAQQDFALACIKGKGYIMDY